MPAIPPGRRTRGIARLPRRSIRGCYLFVAVAVEDHDGTAIGRWHYVRFLRPVNALQTEGAKGAPLVSPKDPRGDMGAVHIDAQFVFTVRADRIAGFGAWREKCAVRHVFRPEVLWQQMQAAGLAGVAAGARFEEA